MSMYTLLRNDPLPSMHQVEEGFQGTPHFSLENFVYLIAV